MFVSFFVFFFFKNLGFIASIYRKSLILSVYDVNKNEVVEPKLQISARGFNTWCIENNMGVHYGKKHSFVVGSKHMISANESISITINEHSIESVNTHKHLGITVENKLTWEQHTDLVCQNVSRKLTLMKLLSK